MLNYVKLMSPYPGYPESFCLLAEYTDLSEPLASKILDVMCTSRRSLSHPVPASESPLKALKANPPQSLAVSSAMALKSRCCSLAVVELPVSDVRVFKEV